MTDRGITLDITMSSSDLLVYYLGKMACIRAGGGCKGLQFPSGSIVSAIGKGQRHAEIKREIETNSTNLRYRSFLERASLKHESSKYLKQGSTYD